MHLISRYKGVGVDDVGAQAAVRDVALDDVSRLRLLAQDGECVVRRDERVQRVDAQPRAGGGVRLAPEVLDLEGAVGGRAHQRGVARDARVRDQVDVAVVLAVCSGFDELDLAAAAW